MNGSLAFTTMQINKNGILLMHVDANNQVHFTSACALLQFVNQGQTQLRHACQGGSRESHAGEGCSRACQEGAAMTAPKAKAPALAKQGANHEGHGACQGVPPVIGYVRMCLGHMQVGG
jgi:hypothetical protein